MTMEFRRPLLPRIELLQAIPPEFADDSGHWLVECATAFLGTNGISNALIHMDDGVLWGIVDGDHLTVSPQSKPPHDDWTPQLRSKTIQQCRLFGNKGELFVWREDEGKWCGRVVIDEEDTKYEQIQEAQILYGSRVHSSQEDPARFTRVFEPTSGIRQIVPEQATNSDFGNGRRLTLTVLHYLTADEDGQAVIYCSRLKEVNLIKL
jgi:CRISPR-associated protein (TIGR03984 family)